MKQGLSIVELAQELQRQQGEKRDFIVPASKITMEAQQNDAGASSASYWTVLNGNGDSARFDPLPLFHRQMGTALKIPAVYYDMLYEDHPELLVDNVNTLMHARQGTQMIRTLDGKTRAFLSDRYRRIDNVMIAEATLPVLGEIKNVRFESTAITDERMYIKAVNPRLQAEIVPGDVVQSGVLISNSEVGKGSVVVMPLIYRLVCSNGMVVNDMGSRKYHVGRASEEQWELFSDDTVRADDKAFMMKLADTVRAAVDQTRFNKIVDRVRETTTVNITGHVPDVVELTAKQFNVRDTEQKSVLDHLIAGGDLSMYGLGNAFTRAAQDVESYDRSTEMEKIGWDVLTMTKDMWRRVNSAKKVS